MLCASSYGLRSLSTPAILIVAAVGCGKPTVDDPLAAIPELQPTGTFESALDEQCVQDTVESQPVLPLSWRGRAETYVVPGTSVSAFAVDYDLSPFPTVDTVSATFATGQRTAPASRSVTAHCPGTLAASLWNLDGTLVNDVAFVRLRFAGTGDRELAADLSYAAGTRSVAVDIAGLDFTTTNPDAQWYALFEPAAGAARVALLPLDSSQLQGSTLTLGPLPDALGRIVLVQTSSVARQGDYDVYHAPAGFAAGYATYATGMYQAKVEPTSAWSTPASPRAAMLVPPNTVATFISLQDDMALAANGTPTVIRAPWRDGSGSIRIRCGATATLRVAGFAQVTVTPSSGSTVTATLDSPVSVIGQCSGGTTYMTAAMSTQALNARGFDIIASEVSP